MIRVGRSTIGSYRGARGRRDGIGILLALIFPFKRRNRLDDHANLL